MAARTTPATRSIEVTLADGRLMRVDNIPSNAKITVGPLQPGGKDGYGPRETALRIYTTAGNQLAVFRDIRSFRDLSLTVKVQEVVTTAASEEVVGPKGLKRSSDQEVNFEWVEA
jgi:hypothetical protein